MKLTKQDIDRVRDMEGFPIGADEDIIKLSNPPFYTACPNPFIEEFIRVNGKPYDYANDNYKREPFAADVSEGKYDPIYKLHPYHTKVPHKAIMRYILHYTEPGDIVLDGFCGTGMTGVAAHLCGYPDDAFRYEVEKEFTNIKWGSRKAILNDISTAATFIAKNFNSDIDMIELDNTLNKVMSECEKECQWMYETNHIDYNGNTISDMYGEAKGKINYTVWSDVFICPNCGKEIIFWDAAVEKEKGKVRDKFNCSNCLAELKKKDCQKALSMIYDEALKEYIHMSKQVPVMINYTYNGKRFEKKPDINDFKIIEKIDSMTIPYWYPSSRMCEGSESRRNDKSGITHVHHFYTKRNLYTLSAFRDKIDIASPVAFAITKVANQLTKQYRLTYMSGCWGAGGGPMSGTLYISSLIKELNMLHFLREAIKIQYIRNNKFKENVIITTQSSTDLKQINNNTIDYIFTDPPFGDNLNYSELNYIWESWLKVYTNNLSEAVVNKAHGKALLDYQNLMSKCFKEYYRVLKPNRWITVEFHNSKNSVWNAIQEALNKAGFIVADVRTLDKKHNSFKQVTANSAVKQDLIISAYKPKESFTINVLKHLGTEETAWDFVREHLSKVPIVVNKSDKIEVVRERESFLLFDRMVAFHIVNAMAVPINSAEFYSGLDDRFVKRDGMYFLHDQVNEYDNARITSELEPIQFSLFVTDEKSAISWLYKELETPQIYAEIQPKFVQELRTVKYEKMPELTELLKENFLQDNDGKWYIPDPSKAGDIVKLREKRLIKEFEEYLNGKGKLKSFRTEAIRAGFAKLWKEKDYKSIVKVANRLPESVIQEDDKLLMYYDISLSRIE